MYVPMGNDCLHTETVDAIADTPLHKKLSLPQVVISMKKRKQDLFAVVIAFRYLLPGKDFLEFKRKLIKEIDRVNREVEHISEVELLNKMGFRKLEKYYQIPFKLKKYPLRDSEAPIVLEDFLLKNFNI